MLSCVLQEQQQLLVAQGRGLEPEPKVEALRLLVDRMGQQGANARLPGDEHGPADGVLEQTDADASALISAVHRQPGEDHNRDRILAHALAMALRRIERIDLAYGEAEIPRDAITVASHEGLGRPG